VAERGTHSTRCTIGVERLCVRQGQPAAVIHEVEPKGRESEDGQRNALSYWRTLPAGAFDATLREEIESCSREIGVTDMQWRAALGGDADATCALALRAPIPARISSRTDLIMTVLLRCCFVDADAATVFSGLLQRMPIDPVLRMRLAVSWLVFAETRL
jgi:hypothetical protein